MEENDTYDESLLLEKLAEAGRLDEFYDAVDEDDFKAAHKILKETGFPQETIKQVLQDMLDQEG